VVRSSDFVQAYFAQLARYQPLPDSSGRVEFLGQLITREILSCVALQVNKPLDYADRAELRRNNTDVLSNVLYRRMIQDSVQVSDAEVAALRQKYHFQKRMQHILFADQATAERVRADLAGKRIPWAQAQARYSKAKNDSGPQGDLGWLNRPDMVSRRLAWVFDLQPGQISTVFRDPEGYQVARVVASRPIVPVAFWVRPERLRSEIRQQKEAALAERLQARLAEQIGLTYDEANIAWAAKFFEPGAAFSKDSLGVTVIKPLKVPLFAPEDTGRVARGRRAPGRQAHRPGTVGSTGAMMATRPRTSAPRRVRWSSSPIGRSSRSSSAWKKIPSRWRRWRRSAWSCWSITCTRTRSRRASRSRIVSCTTTTTGTSAST
jgi:hypothetical protein